MNWYRTFCQHYHEHGLPLTWGLFMTEVRTLSRPCDFEFALRQRPCKLRQHRPYHDYASEYQNV
ncbi:hypothetical protein PHMEG_00013489 [Phytophthora megakarya]|uniref:Uncharacterized protein n=1 Tax=Phytophthora megakarya TaxID=4795 RepID=A0A225W7N9_9STRA|nr:hypothetical protein PHMEG_00013489 [Phytophthora megakarya]